MGKFSFHIEKPNVDKFDKCIRGAGGRGVLMFSTCCAEVRADCIFRVLWEALDGALFVEYSPLAIPPRSSFKVPFQIVPWNHIFWQDAAGRREIVFAMEWLQWEYQLCLWTIESRSWLHWCDPGLWRWPPDTGTQICPNLFQPLVSRTLEESKAPPPLDLHARGEIGGPQCHLGFCLLWKDKCLPEGPWYFPCTGWWDAT